MNLDEVKQFLVDNGEADEVKAFLSGIKDESKIIDEYKKGKQFQSDRDSHADRLIDKFKKEHFPKMVDEEIRRRFPDETTEQKAIRELKQQLDDIRNEKQREEYKSKTMKALTEKSLPLELQDFINAANDDELNDKVDMLSTILSNAISQGVEGKIKSSGMGAPQKSASGKAGVITTREDLQKLSREERLKAYGDGRVKIPGVALEN